MNEVLLMYCGNHNKPDDDYDLLDMLLDRTKVQMNRVPQRGEGVNLLIDNYHVFFEVGQVYTTLDVTDDKHFEKYRIWISDAEIVEEFKKKQS